MLRIVASYIQHFLARYKLKCIKTSCKSTKVVGAVKMDPYTQSCMGGPFFFPPKNHIPNWSKIQFLRLLQSITSSMMSLISFNSHYLGLGHQQQEFLLVTMQSSCRCLARTSPTNRQWIKQMLRIVASYIQHFLAQYKAKCIKTKCKSSNEAIVVKMESSPQSRVGGHFSAKRRLQT